MTLGELIQILESQDPGLEVPLGFYHPHSYRGFYDELAFEPLENTTVGAMLEAARSAVGKTYEGYKGGDYTMSEYTEVYLAHYGCCGEGIGEHLLRYMCGIYKRKEEALP